MPGANRDPRAMGPLGAGGAPGQLQFFGQRFPMGVQLPPGGPSQSTLQTLFNAQTSMQQRGVQHSMPGAQHSMPGAQSLPGGVTGVSATVPAASAAQLPLFRPAPSAFPAPDSAAAAGAAQLPLFRQPPPAALPSLLPAPPVPAATEPLPLFRAASSTFPGTEAAMPAPPEPTAQPPLFRPATAAVPISVPPAQPQLFQPVAPVPSAVPGPVPTPQAPPFPPAAPAPSAVPGPVAAAQPQLFHAAVAAAEPSSVPETADATAPEVLLFQPAAPALNEDLSSEVAPQEAHDEPVGGPSAVPGSVPAPQAPLFHPAAPPPEAAAQVAGEPLVGVLGPAAFFPGFLGGDEPGPLPVPGNPALVAELVPNARGLPAS